MPVSSPFLPLLSGVLNPASTQTQEQQRAATSQQTRNAQATAQSVENTYIPD